MRTSVNPLRAGGVAAALGVGVTTWMACAVASADPGSTDVSSAAATSAPRGDGARVTAARAAHRPTAPAGRGTRSAAQRWADATGTPALAGVPAAPRAAVNPDALPPRPAPRETVALVASSLLGMAQATWRAISIGSYLGPTRSTLNQTVVVDGYDLVPSSTELVTSFYGPWTFWPGGPTLVQGQQKYSVVEPVTRENLGTFEALVSTGSPVNLRGKYVELLVTANDGTNVGTGPGQVPPVGSLIANFDLIGGFGWSYTAMPAVPKAVISFNIVTPFGDIPIPFTFDASAGIADRTVDNRPIKLGNGYSIAPTDPAGETYVGTSGFLPIFTTVQARQMFDVRDASGEAVGSFEGVVTPTADVFGLYTQAILVTRVVEGTPGTRPGDVPPVGSVYNVIYEGADTRYGLYSSLPAPSGNVVSVILVDGDTVSNIRTFPLNLLDAAALPPVTRLPIAGGYSLLPVSPLYPSGVNGLPPREIQIQGYQQFGMYDRTGTLRGSVDADVSLQYDWWGNYSLAILVTGVRDGIPGTAPGEVPPVGSMFTYFFLGDSGLGTSYATLAAPSGNKVSFKILTPLIDIPTWSTYNATAGFDTVSLFNPFATG